MWRKGRPAWVLVGVAAIFGLGAWLVNEHLGEGRLIEQLRSGDAPQRLSAINELRTVGSKGAIRAIADAVRDADTRVACRAVAALGSLGRAEHLPTLRSAAADARPEVRAEAMSAIAGLKKNEADIGLLVAALENAREESSVRAAAAEALGTLYAREAAKALIAALSSDSSVLRAQAGRAIRRISGTDFGFRPDDPAEARSAAIARIQGWYSVIAGQH